MATFARTKIGILGINRPFAGDITERVWDAQPVAMCHALGWDLIDVLPIADHADLSKCEALLCFSESGLAIREWRSFATGVLQAWTGPKYSFMLDARPAFSLYRTIGDELCTPAMPRLQRKYLQALYQLLPIGQHLIAMQNRSGCYFSAVSQSYNRAVVLAEIQPTNCYMHMPNGSAELLSTADYLQLASQFSATLIHVEPCLLECGPWLTLRMAISLKLGQLLIAPAQYKHRYDKSVLGPLLTYSKSCAESDAIMQQAEFLQSLTTLMLPIVL